MLLALAATLLAGCGALYTVSDPNPRQDRYFQLAVPGAGAIAAVPIQVADTTATVVGAEVDGRNPPAFGPEDGFVGSAPGRPDALVVGWAAGCEERADIAVETQGDGRRSITLKLLHQPDCVPARIPRRIIVVFDGPVAPGDFGFVVVQ